MKTERVTLLTSTDFKAFLSAEALREGVSVAELIRSRCEQRPSAEEAVLSALVAELHHAVGAAKRSMREGLNEAQAVLTEIRAGRAHRAEPALPRRSGSKGRVRA